MAGDDRRKPDRDRRFEPCHQCAGCDARGGRLTITTSNADSSEPSRPPELSGDDYVIVSVSDTGLGMTDEVQKKAFEPFFTTKAIGSGTGLGLSQVYGIAKQTGGAVRIDSTLGKGTTVAVYLPRARSLPAHHKAEEEAMTATPVGHARMPAWPMTIAMCESFLFRAWKVWVIACSLRATGPLQLK